MQKGIRKENVKRQVNFICRPVVLFVTYIERIFAFKVRCILLCGLYALNVGKTPNWPNDYKHYLPKNRHLIHKGIVWLCRGYQNDGKGNFNGQQIKCIILIGYLFLETKNRFCKLLRAMFFQRQVQTCFVILLEKSFEQILKGL